MGCGSSSATEIDTNATVNNLEIDQADQLASAIGDSSMISRLDISISCQNLYNTDKNSLSDTFAVLYLKSKVNGPWKEIGRTEVIANSLNPKWVKMLRLMYRFEEVQNLRIDVYNVSGSFDSSDASKLNLHEHIFQGCVETVLALVVGGNNQTWIGPLLNEELPNQNASLSVKAEEVANQNSKFRLQVSASGVSCSGISGLFLRFSRLAEDQSLLPCFKTEVVSKSSNPIWNVIEGTLQNFANGDVYRPINIECFGYKKSGNHILIGSCQKSMEDLTNAFNSSIPIAFQYENSNVCQLLVTDCQIIHVPSFFDYIRGGTELAFIAAIDFTASNGNPSNPDSLHYIDPNGSLNQYASVITAIGSILQYYDTDNLFPVYGFGAKPRPDCVAEHCFAVNGNDANAECEGVHGILNAYHQCLHRVTLHGPTLFAPLINQAAAFVRSTLTNDPSNQTYTVLLILTDGIINDMENTKQAIVSASFLPLSIVIIGIGTADFQAMEILDGDDERLHTSSGEYAKYDIVQFVPMRDFIGVDSYELAREVLDEVPRQLLDYMQDNNIPPGPGSNGQRSAVPSPNSPASYTANAVPYSANAIPVAKLLT